MSAESKVLQHLNLQGGAELRNAVLRATAFIALSAPPSSPSVGEMYFDMTTLALKVWDGTNWASLTATPDPVSDMSLFGTGVDGNVTISTNTVLASNRHYENLTIAAGVSLDTNGWQVFVAGTLTLENGSRIHCNGRNANANVGGTARVSTNFYGGGAAGMNGSNNSGGTAAGVSNAVGGAGGPGGYASPSASSGSLGGNAVAPSASDGGRSAFTLLYGLQTGRAITNPGLSLPRFLGGGGGGAGFGNASYVGAGGGGGGAICVVFAFRVVVNGAASISANGGNGGNGAAGNAGGGGGGGGGGCVVLSRFAQPDGLAVTASGGVGGSGFGTGETGDNGAAGTAKFIVAA
jgi:hypothetical protein